MNKGFRRSFPETFKREAVDRVRTSGVSIKAVAVELGGAQDGFAQVGSSP